MSKVEEKNGEEPQDVNRKLLGTMEEDIWTIEDEDEDGDNYVVRLQENYAYNDVVHQQWRGIMESVKSHNVPLCEYLTVYNFFDFVDKL
jgi:hypothetical protein